MGRVIIKFKQIFHKLLEMKKLLRKATLILTLTGLLFTASGQVISDSAVMGTGYANDIYYSFENGSVLSTPRAAWDIAIHTPIFTATLLTNGSSGVQLYTYPTADTSGWNTLDTAGITWKVLYNSEELWEDGAFNRNATDQFDFGWGKYNPVNHDVVGDSLYIIKCIDGQYRKLWIIRKHSLGNTYYMRYANLDGSNEHNVTLDINPFTSKNFVYFKFPGEELVDREPDTASWDILFTQYVAIQPNGSLELDSPLNADIRSYKSRYRVFIFTFFHSASSINPGS